jgi:hypothetical protein
MTYTITYYMAIPYGQKKGIKEEACITWSYPTSHTSLSNLCHMVFHTIMNKMRLSYANAVERDCYVQDYRP